ncbi:hypothetical protein ACMUMS_16380 [Acinetobacter courvalinii]|uniref:hypothetical protein n=1 Tax=Acinetobacter courvalinii TaxID=280147 RepID=UPI003A86A2D2
MPNQNTPKTYDIYDIYDVQSLAAIDMDWMETSISNIRGKFKELSKNLEERYSVHDCDFTELETLIDMFHYVALMRTHYHQQEEQAYKAELETLKGGR